MDSIMATEESQAQTEVEVTTDRVAERANRLAKLEAFKAAGIHPYPARFEKTIDLKDVARARRKRCRKDCQLLITLY